MAQLCEIGPLPIWVGPQPSPGLTCAPFELAVDDAGLVCLQSEDIVSEMIQVYSRGLAAFHTAPPGTSDWANCLADSSLAGLKQLCGSLQDLNVMELGGGNLYCAERMISELGAKSVTVVDPAIEEGSNNDNLQVHRDYFNEETSIDREFDLIVLFSALEHVPDPYGFLRGARRHLTDDGVILIKVPDCKDGLARGDLGICLHQHVSYFTADSLDVVLQRAGFERIGDANYAGGLQVLARRVKPDPAARCTSDGPLLDKFSAHARVHVSRLREFAEGHKGGRAAFIGASVGLCNILYLSRITDLIEVEVFDGNSVQTCRYLPGVEVPIRHTSDRCLEKHSHVFIAPVNFVNEIRASLVGRLDPKTVQISAVFPAF